ncbi:superinfection immunity protein [Maricaulis sp.]|uniref:superinfection immunity protein n=1 Tax=Maricaulis sp. TaxID=1486257 RepID=UPI0025BEAFD1|nr:superinfection immunity protein [Maricaulis sp.]
MEGGSTGGAIVLIIIYFVPGIVALMRGHHNAGAIFLTNLVFGWTLLGWLLALIWSFTAKNKAVVDASPRAATTAPRRRQRQGIVVDIVGESFNNEDGTSRQAIIQSLQIGERVTLIPEPKNPYDSAAIAVHATQGVIGYLSRDDDDLREAARSGKIQKVEVDAVGPSQTGHLGVRLRVICT